MKSIYGMNKKEFEFTLWLMGWKKRPYAGLHAYNSPYPNYVGDLIPAHYKPDVKYKSPEAFRIITVHYGTKTHTGYQRIINYVQRQEMFLGDGNYGRHRRKRI